MKDTQGDLMNGSITTAISFLEYYADPSRELDYAVLINGQWGSGKTHVVKDIFLKNLNVNNKYLYISLYGISNYAQIEENFYRQVHPVLSSKEFRFAGSVLKGFLRTAVKIDIDGDGKDDATITSQIPDIALKDYFSTPSGTLLVFDDLERCTIPTSEILGYINHFVEHSGFKAIIIANESRIFDLDKKYKDIKEKLVGQTLLLRPDFDSAFPSFVSTLTNKKAADFAKLFSADIKKTFDMSETNNLRILKQSLWSFERLANTFEEKHWLHAEELRELMVGFIALSLEAKSGRMTLDEMKTLNTDRFRYLFNYEKKKETVTSRMATKYPSINFTAIITPDILVDVIFNGIVNAGLIIELFNSTAPFAPPRSEPAWIRAWHGYNRSDDEFDAAVLEVEDQFKNQEFTHLGDIVHVFGLRLRFALMGAITQSAQQVVDECKSYIDDLSKKNLLGTRVPRSVDEYNGWRQLAVSQHETSEFLDIFEYLKAAIQQKIEENYPDDAQKLLDIAASDTSEFFRMLCHNNFERSEYAEVPILNYIDHSKFLDMLEKLPPNSQNDVMLALKSRYDSGGLSRTLSTEKDWLCDLVSDLDLRLPGYRVNSRDRLGRLSSNLKEILAPPNE
ncbi:P-loop NTPase fold protein [Brucella sp. NBRC 12950]|uniref:P-loop NTPase fold protein n=1 Tax=Brucella sp. NBRC 12950 TaxID=2994518 RepID=UPI00249FEC9D|nr:P-loop NTPase fold protein [Brucella sp. NBRC 12950]GLU28011.1 NTPase [Brucella sp. NBRC 12950]